jgi:hypothetical protein
LLIKELPHFYVNIDCLDLTQALSEATGPFIIETITDKSESYRLFHLAADRFKITYKIIVDENRMKNWTSPNRKTQLLETGKIFVHLFGIELIPSKMNDQRHFVLFL